MRPLICRAGPGRREALDRLVQQLIQARERGAHGLQLLPGADHLAHRGERARGQNGRGDQRADRQLAGDDRARADVDDQQRHALLQHLARARDHAAEVTGLEVARCGIGETDA